MYIIRKPHVVSLNCLEMVENMLMLFILNLNLHQKGWTVYLSKTDYTVLMVGSMLLLESFIHWNFPLSGVSNKSFI